MPARKLLPLFFFAALGLTVITGCGGNSQSAGLPHGNFTNANLTGTYAFAFSGTNFNAGTFFTMAGSLQANGSGTITGGTIDINSPGSATSIVTNAALTGTYIVHADGRGSATLTAAGLSNNVNIDFVLFSNQHGAVIRFDTFATASGSLDLQNSSAFSLSSLAGSLVFNVGGADAGGLPEDSVGVFTVTSSGAITGGVQDTSDNGTVTQNEALVAATGAMGAPSSGNGRGTLTIGSATLGARHYAYYVVSATQIRMIGIDSAPVLAGDAFRQSSTTITGPSAFTVSGATGNTTFFAGGILNIDASGDHGSSVEDVIAIGSAANQNVALSGSFSAVTNGRSTLSMNGATINYAAYPSSGGLQLLRTDSALVAAGTAFQQSGSFSNNTINGRYGASLSGVLFNGINFLEFDAVHQLSANGAGQITGAQDINSPGAPATNLIVHGTFALGSNGRSTSGTLNTAAVGLDVFYYAVDSTHILFIAADTISNTAAIAVAVGALSQQQ
jgi:hypothetical protein